MNMTDYLSKTATLLRADIKSRIARGAFPLGAKHAKISVRVVPLKNIVEDYSRIVVTITAWNGAVFRDAFTEWVLSGECATDTDGFVSYKIPGIFEGKHGSDQLRGGTPHKIGAMVGPAQLDRYGIEVFDELTTLHPALITTCDALRERALVHCDARTGPIVVDLYQIKRNALEGMRDERDGETKHAADKARTAHKAAHPDVRIKLEHRTAHGEEMLEFRTDASPRLADLISATDDINRAIADASATLAPFEPKRSEATVQVVYGRWVVIVMANCKRGAAAALGLK